MKYKPRINLSKRLRSWPYRVGCLALVLLIIFGTLYFRTGHSKAITDTFTTSGTWTVPTNVFSATFEAWGGGGAGAGSASNGTGGGGGAGGQYAVKNSLTVNPTDNYTVTVATTVAGGTGAGATGNDSQVADPSTTVFLRAKGGAGGIVGGAGGTGSTTNGIGDSINRGGSGGAGSGSSATAGGGGGGAGSTGNGGDGSGQTAGTGTSTNGGNGGTGGSGNYTGVPGNNYAGGGSGGSKSNASSRAGGGGAPGLVTVTYTVTPPSYNQTSFEFFDNANSTTPGAAHGNNTNYTLASTGQAFRLRQLIKVNGNQGGASYNNTVVDSNGVQVIAAAIGSDGFARIIYSTNTTVQYAQCTNYNCSTSNITTFEASTNANYADISIGSDGFPRISYVTSSNVLKFVQCSNDACTSNSINTVSSTAAKYSTMRLGLDGFGRFAYQDQSVGALKFVRCTNAACSTSNTNTVDAASSTGSDSALTIASDGFGRMTYKDITTNAQRFAQCTNNDCSTSNLVTIDSGPTGTGFQSSIDMGLDGFARLSYSNGVSSALRYAQCTNAGCTTPNITSVDTGSSIGSYSSLRVASDGFARIAYVDLTNGQMKFAKCTNDACTSSSISTLVSGLPSAIGDKFMSLVLVADQPYVAHPIGGASLINPAVAFKLQYAAQGAACSSATYSDVTTSSAIAFNNNSTPKDRDAITYQSGTDPTDSGQTVTAQTYQELNNFTNTSTIGLTVDGEWDFSLKDNGASASTAYCLRAVQYDGSTTTAFATYTNYPVITTSSGNTSPDAPTLITPAASATNVAFTPQFTLRTTDADSDYIRYRIYLYQSDCSTAVGSSPFNQNASQTGWSGQDASGNTAYVGNATLTLSTIATYTYQGKLAGSTTYCWKADAIDPGGINTFGSTSSTQNFTTQPPIPTDIKGGVNIRGGTIIQ